MPPPLKHFLPMPLRGTFDNSLENIADFHNQFEFWKQIKYQIKSFIILAVLRRSA